MKTSLAAYAGALLTCSLLACGGTIDIDTTPNSNPDASSSPAMDAGSNGSPADAGSGSSGADAATNPDCADVSGSWTPEGFNTCVAPGDACSLTQNGCLADLDCSNGAFSVSGDVVGDTFELVNGANRCTGRIDGDRLQASCEGPQIPLGACSGSFRRAGG